jgi:hypothetical protein
MVSLSTWECASYLYEPQKLEVHFHSTGPKHEVMKMARLGQGLRARRKANIVADALSRKAHRNYLPAIQLTGEESSTRVLLDLSLFSITLTPTLRDEIKAAQKNDEGMGHIKKRMHEGDPKGRLFSARMQKGPYGSRKDWLCLRKKC